MSENLELDLSVDKVTEAKGEERVITVALKGEKAIVVDPDPKRSGFDLIDVLEVKLTIKCGMNETLEQLGIERYMNRKVIVLRDRDESLQSFQPMFPAAIKEKIA